MRDIGGSPDLRHGTALAPQPPDSAVVSETQYSVDTASHLSKSPDTPSSHTHGQDQSHPEPTPAWQSVEKWHTNAPAVSGITPAASHHFDSVRHGKPHKDRRNTEH